MGNCHNFLFSHMNFCAFIMDDTERSVGEHCFPRCRSSGRDREKEEIPVIDRQAFRNTIASIKHQPAFVCSQTAATKAGLLGVPFSRQPLQNRVPRVRSLLPLPVENGSTVRFWAVFLLLFKLGTRSVLPHFDTRNRCGFTIRRHTLTTIPSVTSSIKHQNFSSDWISAGAFLCLLRYKFWLKFQSPRLCR